MRSGCGVLVANSNGAAVGGTEKEGVFVTKIGAATAGVLVTKTESCAVSGDCPMISSNPTLQMTVKTSKRRRPIMQPPHANKRTCRVCHKTARCQTDQSF